MFKNNKFKKILAFSVVSASFFICGTSVSGAVRRSQSFGGFASQKTQPSVRRASSLSDLGKGVEKYLTKLSPFTYVEERGGIMSFLYESRIIFEDGVPIVIFRNRDNGRLAGERVVSRSSYNYTKIQNVRDNYVQFSDVMKSNNS